MKTNLLLRVYSLKKQVLFLSLFFGSMAVFSQATEFYQGGLAQSDFDALITTINTRTVALQSKIDQANIAGLETSYAESSLVTASEFLGYASRDRANATALQTRYEGNGYRFFNRAFEEQLVTEGITGAPNYSVIHPFQELLNTINVLDFAIAEIDSQLDGTIVLQPTQNLNQPGNQLTDGDSYYTLNGNINFPSTFWTMPPLEPLMENIGYLGEIFNSPINMDTNAEDFTTRLNQVNSRVRELRAEIAANQVPTQVHYTHTGLRQFLLNRFPGIGAHPRAFVHYDINHPEINNILEPMIDSFNGPVAAAAGNSPLIYVISNEPHWDMAQYPTVSTGGFANNQSSDGVSQNTMNAYVEHLRDEYNNDIAQLNAVYNPFNNNRNFTDFTQLSVDYTIPLTSNAAIGGQGSPIWYDWLRFNMDRSNQFHTDLKRFARDNDPDAKISIKILGRELEDPRRDGGIDIEALMDMQEVIGFDAQVVPSETHGRNNRFYRRWITESSMDWREQAMILDFAKSIYPNKPVFDSEWHGTSSNAWNNYTLDRDYVKAALWMAFTDGMSVINNWWWYREHEQRSNATRVIAEQYDLENKTSTVGNIMFSIQHQAVAFDTFGRTMKELNANSNAVASLVKEERDVLIYYSNEASIQDFRYPQQMSDIYEALKLMNISVGFTTPSKINSLGYVPANIIIPPTPFAKDETITALETFKTANPSARLVQVTRGAIANFGADEKGTPNTSRDASFIDSSFAFNNVIPTLITRLRGGLTLPVQPIEVSISSPGTTDEEFGVLARFGTAEGLTAVSLINVSSDNRRVRLPATGDYVNLLDNRTFSNDFEMAPNDVLLLIPSDTNTLDIDDFTKDEAKPFIVYPNPATDVVNVNNTTVGTYTMYNALGKLVKIVEADVSNTNITIQVGDLSTGIYFLEIPTPTGKSVVKILIR